jgi:hypothetical protein
LDNQKETVKLGDVKLSVQLPAPEPPPPPPETPDWFKKEPFPIDVIWLKGKGVLDFSTPATWRIVGIRYSGKSSLAEAIATRYYQEGGSIYDIFAANDNESLAWLDSPFKEDVALIHGAETTLDCPYKTITIDQLDPSKAPNQKIFILCRAFFGSETLYYHALARLSRNFAKRDAWTKTHVVLIREAQEYITSQLRAGTIKSQKDAENEFIKFHNQLFHYGMAVIVDSQRDVAVNKNIRELTTYLCMKNIGNMEIDRKLWHLLRYIDPERLLRALKPYQFVIWTEGGALGIGYFMLPPWHHRRGQSILKRLGITIHVDEEKLKSMEAQVKPVAGRWNRVVTDELHKEIVRLHEQEGKSFNAIAISLGLNPSTVKHHYNQHRARVCNCI